LDGNPATTLLVFPVDMDAAGPFLSVSRALGIRIIGASSVDKPLVDPALMDELVHLPYISDPGFEDALNSCLDSHGVTHIHTPHPGVWTVLREIQGRQSYPPRFRLCQPSPYQAIWRDSSASYAWADSIVSDPLPQLLLGGDNDLKPSLESQEYAWLHKRFMQIPGQCDMDKLRAFVHLARVLPRGDLVEIGSFAGRSAFALAWLADRYHVGNLISIDPWSNQAIEAQGRQAEILNRDMDAIDFEKIFLVYLSNLSLLKNAAYIREISIKAIDRYKQAAARGVLYSPRLPEVAVQGRISLLHIDGNHEYSHVRQDIEAWEPLVVSGGWVLLDDYRWAFGDGPKRAGDELLAGNGFEQAFTLGDTLYLKKGTSCTTRNRA
jgi:hypothetical protein